MNTICLVVDRLHAGYLGCYGNSWIATPHFDGLAAEGFVADQALVDSTALSSLCDAFWSGRHVLAPPDAAAAPLPAQRAAAGDHTLLVTDEPAVAEHPLGAGFSEHVQLQPGDVDRAADEAEETHLGRFFAAAIDALSAARPPLFAWLHTRGMAAPWDAPLALRQGYADEGDPPPPEGVEVPALQLPEDYDPDLLLGIRQAYAGQVSLLDTCLGWLLAFLEDRGLRESTLLAVVSLRGFPLGEHRVVGVDRPDSGPLYNELVQAAWLLRFAGGTGAAQRSGALVQPPDLYATLADWTKQPAEAAPWRGSLLPLVAERVEQLRDRALLVGEDDQRGLRTPAWYLRAAGGRDELYAKPEDRWEVNEVADRCPQVVEAMTQLLAAAPSAFRAPRSTPWPPLEPILLEGLE